MNITTKKEPAMNPSNRYKTAFAGLAGMLATLAGLAALAAPALRADTDAVTNRYFRETFDTHTIGANLSSAHLAATNAFSGSGGVKVYNDFGGSGTTPSQVMFGEGEVFLNVNRDLVSTTSAFTGGYSIITEVTYKNGYQSTTGKNTFSSSSDISSTALQVMLRMSSPTAWDGLVLRFYPDGAVRLWSSSGNPNGVFTSIGSITGFPNLYENTVLLKIVDTGTDISIYYANNSLAGTFANVTHGAANAGYLAIGQAGQYQGTKFNSIEVAAIPESKTAALLVGGIMLALAFGAGCLRRGSAPGRDS
jgi:hypothetical protein